MANIIQETQLTRSEQCTQSIESSIVDSRSPLTCQNVTFTTTTHSPATSVTLQDSTAISITSPFQPVHYDFPKTKFGKQFRSCQGVWFRNFPWLHYDASRDYLLCYVCSLQNTKLCLESSRNKEDCFITSGFSNWKHALEYFKQHENSKCHRTALTYEYVVPKCGDALAMVHEKAKTVMEGNRRCFLKILQSIRYLGRQGIAFQGDTEASNFLQLMKLRAMDDPILGEWIAKGGDTYLSHDIQNEILQIMSNTILRDLAKDIRPNFYSIICDEYTDITNKEQMSFCLRWVNEEIGAREDFLGFYNVPNIESKTLLSAIQDILTRFSLPLKLCRGQCYDGASNMLGRKSGVGTKICEIQPKALLTHCHAHSLSLSVKDTTSDSKVLSDAMDISREIITLVKCSPKREKILGEIKDNIEGAVEDLDERAASLTKLSTTRWTVRATSFQRIIDNYDQILELWRVCLEAGKLDSNAKARIIGCEHKMKNFEFFFGLNLGQRLFVHTDNLSKTLQGTKLSAISGKRLALLTKTTLEKIRNTESFNLFYDTVLLKAKQHSLIGEPKLPRKRHCPARYEEGSRATFAEDPRDSFRQIYFEAVDLMVHSIDLRFSQPCFKAYEQLESFCF